ncbi:MAG TPA: FtsX-like permease family protein [Chloroflexota bacterium]
MNAVLTKILSDIRRRRTQTAVIVIIVVLASCIATMALTLVQEAGGPYDRAFAQQRGAHLVVLFDPARVIPSQLRATQLLPGVTATGGPWAARGIAFSTTAPSPAAPPTKFMARVIGRTTPRSAVERLHIVAGRWVNAPGEIVLSKALAGAAGVTVGDRIVALINHRKLTYLVAGEAIDINLPDSWNPQKAWVVSSDPLVAGGTAPGYYEVAYRFRQASTAGAVARDLTTVTAALPAGALVRSFSWLEARADVNILATLVMTFLLAFSVFALAACALIVANIVAGAVLASYHDIGILKGIGFTPGQVVGVFAGQMLLPAVAGCVIGIPVGVLGSLPILQNASGAMDLPAPSGVAPISDLLVLVGVLAVVGAAAALPARRAGDLDTVRAITQGSAEEHGRSSRMGAILDTWGAPRFLSLGVGATFARRLRGTLTVVAVLIGVATLTFAVAFRLTIDRMGTDPAFHSLDYVGGSYQVRLMPRGGYTDAQVTQLLRAQPGTQYVVAYADGFVTVPGVADPIQAIGVRGDATRLGYRALTGRWFVRPGEVVLGGAAFKATHAHLGDTLTVRYQGRPVQLRVVGTYFDTTSSGRVMRFSYADLLRLNPGMQPFNYAIQLRPNTNTAAYVRRLQAAEPNFVALETFSSKEPDSVVLLRSVVTALAVILGLIAIVGVFNTVLLNTRERLRDVAVLKALGMSPAETVAMIAASACVIGLLGGVLGVPVGVFLQERVLSLMAGTVGSPTVPGGTGTNLNAASLVILALAGVVLSVLGASLPARWAAHSPVVETLHFE